MEHDPLDDDGPVAPLLPPEDRLWRHPSEMGVLRVARQRAQRAEPTPWLMGVLGGVIGALLVAGLLSAAGALGPDAVIEQVAVPSASRSAGGTTTDIPSIADQLRPAIVQVRIAGTARDAGSASGVVFRSDGHILTNFHAVHDAQSVIAVFDDGDTRPARVVGGDRETDVAVLKVDGDDYRVATLGTALELRVGELAIAMGSPADLANGPSLSVGVISALSREVQGDDGPLLDMIQTDAPLAAGSMGGALVNGSGAVIGITTGLNAGGAMPGHGIGYATPIDIARDVADQLIRTGRVVHVWLGVEGEDVSKGMRLGVDKGALVKMVTDGSPAATAGLAPGDVIVNVAGSRVTSMIGLRAKLRARRPGDVVRLQVLRNGRVAEVTATLAARPSS